LRFERERLMGEVFYAFASSSPGKSVIDWAAAGFEDTELGVLLEPEVGHGATEVYARVQA
jgi:hypothetical protein